jgi:preprotein translocase subunit YajC
LYILSIADHPSVESPAPLEFLLLASTLFLIIILIVVFFFVLRHINDRKNKANNMKKDSWKGHSYWQNVYVPLRFALTAIALVVIVLLIYFDLIKYFGSGRQGFYIAIIVILIPLVIAYILIDRNIRKKEKKEKAEIKKIEENILRKQLKK